MWAISKKVTIYPDETEGVIPKAQHKLRSSLRCCSYNSVGDVKEFAHIVRLPADLVKVGGMLA